jgi:ATP-binding cassette subfamily G (WHITE) protein 2 (PDR)
MCTYLAATEYIAAKRPKGEVLLFRRGHRSALHDDVESSSAHVISQSPTRFPKSPAEGSVAGDDLTPSNEVSVAIQKQTAVFQWKDICFDIKVKKELRRILDHIDGWVKPGTLTALMVCSTNPSCALLGEFTDR